MKAVTLTSEKDLVETTFISDVLPLPGLQLLLQDRNHLHPFHHSPLLPLSQITLASCMWLQLWFPHPLCAHWPRFVSFPQQARSSSQICPLPSPKYELIGIVSTPPYPSCLHTTLASSWPQPSPQIVPQVPTRYISTRPSCEPSLPSVRRTS